MALQRSLFRNEAIEFQERHRQWGSVALLQPLSTKVLTWFFTTTIAVIVVFGSMANYARKETVAGYLTPTSGTAKIFATREGTVTAIHVEAGQTVAEGQPLVSIATGEVAGDGEDVNSAKLEALTRQRAMLAAQISAEEHRTASERDRLNATISDLEAELSQLDSQVRIQDERIHLSEDLVSKAVYLRGKGYMSDIETKRHQATLLEQKQSLNSLSQQIAARRDQLTQTQYSLDQLPTTMGEKIQLLRNELSDTEQRIVDTKGRRAYSIRAPMAGRVSMLQATIGQRADPKRLLLEIIPAGGALQAELFVPTRASGFVRVGQPVRILYDAFPYQSFGAYRGHIVQLSDTVVTSADAGGPVALKEPSYRATVALDRQDVDAYGKKTPLQPDMLLRADIILDRRPLLSWLVAPLLSARM